MINVFWKFYLNMLFYDSGLVKYDPMRASSYLPLPKELKAKGMSKYSSILASLHPVQHGTHLNRVSKYQEYEHEWNISAIQCTIDIKDIGKFEHQNNISINVSVNRYEDKQIFPLRITTKTVAIHYVNLLCITAGWKISSRICERIEQTGIKSITNNRKHRTYFC